MSKLARRMRTVWVAALILSLSACSSYIQSRGPTLPQDARWAVAVPDNLTSAMNADLLLQQMLGTALAQRDITAKPYPNAVRVYQAPSLASAIGWARSNGIQYVVASTIGEWGYRGNGKGGPAIGVTLVVIRAADQQVLWQASGARSDWAGRGLDVTALKVAKKLVDDIPLQRR